MFGYVTPVKEELRQQDYALFKAFYCGICVQIGKDYGSLPRFSTTYDITFLALFTHDILSQEVQFREGKCIGNPFQKKLIVESNPLMERLCALNVIMAYYKLSDDVIDGGGGGKRRLARALCKKAYRKAVEKLPRADEILKTRYEQLRNMEREGESSLDKVSHSFASLLKEVTAEVLGENAPEHALSLCYNIGKFVYLIDALDDIDDDAKSGNYNPFLVGVEKFESRREFFDANKESIEFTLACTVNRAIECFNNLKFTQSYTLLKNIIHDGLRAKVKEVLSSDKKIPRPRI